jgi:serine/threonine protein kinase
MGVVYLAEDTALGREVAVKMVRPSLSLDTRSLDRFKREARAVAALDHAHIVHINTLSEVDGALLIEMPFLSGGSLRQRARKGLSYQGLARALGEVLQALDCCHERGIVHRDVKPGNILFDGKLSAKLSDFGAAVLLDEEWSESTRSGGTLSFIGTPHYACPEAWNNESPAATWDLYALGMVAREALTGEAVYRNDTPLTYLRDLIGKEIDPLRQVLPGVSPELAGLIDDLHARKAENRPPSAAEAFERLAQAPEFQGAADEESPTAGTLLPKPPSSRQSIPQLRTTWNRWKRLTPRLLPWALTAVLLLSTAFLLTHRPESNPDSSKEVIAAVDPKTQEEVLQHAIPSIEQLPSLLRDPHLGATAIYALRGSHQPETASQMLVRRALGPEPAAMVGMLNGFFTVITLEPGDGAQLNVSGLWGTYGDDAGQHLLYGSVRGIAEWSGQINAPFWMRLDYIDEMDPVAWSESVLAIPLESDLTDTALALRWESDAKAMPVYWKELWYRYPNAMRPALNYLPAIVGATARTLEASAPLNLDGMLDEPDWTRDMNNFVPAHPGESDASLRSLRDKESIVIGLDWKSYAAYDTALTLTLMPFYHVPSHQSPYLKVEVDDANKLATWIADDIRSPIVTGWSIALNDAAGSAELRIHNDALKRTVPPLPGEVYRVNAQLRDKTNNEVLLCWGWPDVDKVQHGAVLRFGT